MKKCITSAAFVMFAAVAVSFSATPDKAAMEAKEKSAWQAYKDKKADDFKNVVDKDVRVVYADGIHNLQSEVADMPKWDVKSFDISEFSIFSDEKDVVVATYMVKIDATYEGKDMSGTYIAGTVWKQEKGQWMAIFHTHVKQEAASDAQKKE
jgi:hypothetical protein